MQYMVFLLKHELIENTKLLVATPCIDLFNFKNQIF